MKLREIRAELAREIGTHLNLPAYPAPPATIDTLPCVVIFPGQFGPGTDYWVSEPSDTNRVTFCASSLYYQAWIFYPAHVNEHAWDELDDIIEQFDDLELCTGSITNRTSPNQFVYNPSGQAGINTLAVSITIEISQR